MPRVTGPFDVRLGPLEHSDLQGTAKGEMLTAGTAVTGSAVYVAIERVQATLAGRTGSFALHHTGVMTRGAPTLTVTVVPDSGTDGLEGIAGRLDIIFEGQQHVYVLDYTLPGD
jgi:hypothetical protein